MTTVQSLFAARGGSIYRLIGTYTSGQRVDDAIERHRAKAGVTVQDGYHQRLVTSPDYPTLSLIRVSRISTPDLVELEYVVVVHQLDEDVSY